MPASDAETVLDAVRKRPDVLESAEGRVVEKRELVDELDLSRSTVNRAVNELQELGLLRETDDGHRLTAFGQFAYSDYRSLLKRYDSFLAAKPLFDYLPDEFPLAAELIDEAEVVLSEPPAPEEPIIRLEDLVRTGESVESAFPVVTYRYVDLFEAAPSENGESVDLLFDSECLTYLSAEFRSEVTAAVERGDWTVWRIADKPPYGLTVVDGERFWLGVYDADGGLKGAFVGEADELVAWAHDVLDGYRERGQRFRSADVRDDTFSKPIR